MRRVGFLVAGCFALLLQAAPAGAEQQPVTMPGGQVINAPVTSYFALRFKQVVRQSYDISCGAAALATLMKYYWGIDTDEKKIIEGVLAGSSDDEKKKINADGFSMLELKHMGESLGFASGGFRLDSVEKLAKLKVPVLTLITVRGYKHFVVLKGLSQGQVYIADPAFGNRSRSLERFTEEWDGVILVFVNSNLTARNDFFADGSLSGRANEILPLIDRYARPIERVSGEF
jgi:predicted double-glycine peptidase